MRVVDLAQAAWGKALLPSLALNLLLASALGWMVYQKRAQRAAERLPAVERPAVEAFAEWPHSGQPVVMLGDSLTAQAPWSELLCGVLNRGVGGNTTQQILERLHEVTARKPAQLVLMAGINDLLQGIPRPRILQNIDTIVVQVSSQSPNTRLVLASVLPVSHALWTPLAGERVPNGLALNPLIVALNVQLQRLAASKGIHFMNFAPELTDERAQLRAELTNDGVHLTPAGYQLWKRALLGANVGLPAPSP